MCRKKITTDDFINNMINIHNGFYNYENTIYVSAHKKVIINCPIHGEFEQTPNNHKYFGCIKCGINRTKESLLLTDTFLMKQFRNIHGDKYEYSKVIYKCDSEKITIICPIHGEFTQTPSNHKMGKGCTKCAGRYVPTTSEIINQFKSTHGDYYDYSNVIYVNHHKKIKIICPIHGEFSQTPNSHKRGSGCPSCNESKGEKEIQDLLKLNKIKFIRQYKFNDCINKKHLPFDFYLPDYNICIEFNGIQHYEPIIYFGGNDNFIKQLHRDKIKKEYCNIHNIPLIIIKYNENITRSLFKSGILTIEKNNMLTS